MAICTRCKEREAFTHNGKQGKVCAVCALVVLDEITGGAVRKYAGLKLPKPVAHKRRGGKAG